MQCWMIQNSRIRIVYKFNGFAVPVYILKIMVGYLQSKGNQQTQKLSS